VLTEVRNRGVTDVCIVGCDGLKGLPDAINTTWPAAITQTCVLPLIRNTFRLAGRQHWERMARDLRPVYCAPNQAAAKERHVEFFDAWADLYPAVRTLRDNAWADFVPFLDYSRWRRPRARRRPTGAPAPPPPRRRSRRPERGPRSVSAAS
jgi:putative transposase